MIELPTESRPLRLAPEVRRALEQRLRNAPSKRTEAVHAAILQLYHSGKQMPLEQWVSEYDQAVTAALKDTVAA